MSSHRKKPVELHEPSLVKIGAKIKVRPGAFNERTVGHYDVVYATGTVVYINRPHKYFTVQIDLPGGSFLESFKFVERKDDHDRPGNGSGAFKGRKY